jgi:hypothetical protein
MLELGLGMTGRLEGEVTDDGIVLRSACPLDVKDCDAFTDYQGAPMRTFLLANGRLVSR